MMPTAGTGSRGLRLFDLPGLVRGLIRHRDLIRTMTWRSFTSRYQGSFGGLFWAVFEPLVMMVIYTVVFSLFLKVRFDQNPSPFAFAVYLLCGLLPWSTFSEGISGATNIVRSNANLVKRVVFPLEILPVNLALAAALRQLIGFALLVPLAWLVKGQIYWTIVFVPVILFLQLLFCIGMNWVVAGLAVYLPDMRDLISLLLTAWMFMTPIFYPAERVPGWAMTLFRFNPMACLVGLYRDAVMNGVPLTLGGLLGAFLPFAALFVLGYSWFVYLKTGFIDVL